MWIWQSDNTKFLRHSSSGTSSASRFSRIWESLSSPINICVIPPVCSTLLYTTRHRLSGRQSKEATLNLHPCQVLQGSSQWGSEKRKPKKNQTLVSISRRCFCNSVVWQTACLPDLKWTCVMNSGLSLQLQGACYTFPHIYCLLISLIPTNNPWTSCHRFSLSSLNCCWKKKWYCKGRSNYPYNKDMKKPYPQSVM